MDRNELKKLRRTSIMTFVTFSHKTISGTAKISLKYYIENLVILLT